MTLSLTIAVVTGVLVCASVVFLPSFKLGKLQVDAYLLVAVLGAVACLVSGVIPIDYLRNGLVADTAVNPLKILLLFLSMTFLSVYLDELGVFEYLANKALAFGKGKQTTLFVTLYVTVAVLTVFTSNDIIVLTFTPFICAFCRRANVSPIPYLFCEFIAANTWSMCLVIGNPTNIYLATSAEVGFGEYFKVMALPTLTGGVVAFAVLCLLFARKLSAPMRLTVDKICLSDKTEVAVGTAHLVVCLVLLAVGSYVGLEMWIAAVALALSLCVFTEVISLARRTKPVVLEHALKRLPYQLVPFVLSMFVVVLSMQYNGDTERFAELLNCDFTVWSFGLSGVVVANVINNIPMSVLYSAVLDSRSLVGNYGAMYASVVASNIGAYLTPVGALAGIMWLSILKKENVDVGFVTFVKYGAAVALPTIAATLAVLSAVI